MINDELFLSFNDNGTLPDDTEITVNMKMGTYRQILKPLILDVPEVEKYKDSVRFTNSPDISDGQIWERATKHHASKIKIGDQVRIINTLSSQVYGLLSADLMFMDGKILGHYRQITIKNNYRYISG